MRKRIFCVFLSALSSLLAQDEWTKTDGWHTLHYDVQRRGRTMASPAVPFKYLWHREYLEDQISPEADPIVAEGKVFFGTWKGDIIALNADSGEMVWSHPVEGGIRHAPCYADGNIYYASIGGPQGGVVEARNAKSGELVWSFKTGLRGGYATSPALYKNRVYLGDRLGVFYCLDAKDGKKLWEYSANDEPYMMSATAYKDKIYVASEDMVPRCLDAEAGKLLWEASLQLYGNQMQGDTCRYYYPVIWRDMVIFSSCTLDPGSYEDVLKRSPHYTEGASKYKMWSKEWREWMAQLHSEYTPEKHKAEQQMLVEAMREGKVHQSVVFLNQDDGKEEMLVPLTYAGGAESGWATTPPPVVDFNDRLHVHYKTIYTYYEYPIHIFDCLGILNYETGLPERLPKKPETHSSAFAITNDESNAFMIAGNKLFNGHDHNLVYYDMDTHHVHKAFAPKGSLPESWGGIYLAFGGVASSPDSFGEHPLMKLKSETAHLFPNNEWNGSAVSSPAVVGKKVFWITGNMVIALEGK